VTTTTVTSQALVPAGPNNGVVAPRRRRGRRPQRGKMARLSPAGLAFLKCAFAPPDFSIDPGMGIPDIYHGKVIPIKDCATSSLVFTPAKDTFIISSVVPGYAYFKCEVDIGTDPKTFVGVPYPSYDTNFGGPQRDCKYTQFRYGSTCLGLYPTSNLMQFAGSVQVWKADIRSSDNLQPSVVLTNLVKLTPEVKFQQCEPDVCGLPEKYYIDDPAITRYSVNNLVERRIMGLESITSVVPRDNYSESFIKGAYSYAVDIDEFAWQKFTYANKFQNENHDVESTKILQWDGTRQLTGIGNMETIIMKVTTPAAAVNAATLKVWTCMEMQPKTNSALYQFATTSPSYDYPAMQAYRQVATQMPVAVPCSQNNGSWDRVKRIIGGALMIGAAATPGVGGMVAAGVGGLWQLGTGIADLFI